MAQQEIFLLIINPIAGGIDKSELVGMVEQYAEQHTIKLIQYETTGKDDELAIKQHVTQYQPKRVLVAGGDGTIKMVAEAIEEYDVVMGILPAGSANGLSVDLNLPDTLEENLEIAFNGSVLPMDIVTVNNRRSLHLSDIGVNAELIRNYENGTVRGKLGYALQILNTLIELEEPFEATVKANNATITTEARMVVIANTNRYGTGVTINPIGEMNDGKFEIVILKNLDISVIGKILLGNIPLDENVVLLSTSEACITTNIPISFQVDGEYCGKEQKLDIKILPQQLKVAVPAQLT